MSAAKVVPGQPMPPPSAGSGSWADGPRGAAFAAVFFLGLTVAALGATLFSREMVFSNAERDIALQFIHWRKFGFEELRAGRLALWNPHIYCGAPFFGGFQSALLYPPNWLYLCLPLAVAINTGIALHVFLAGFGMFLWTRERGLQPLAALFGGVLFMFSAPFFGHIYAGHLSNLCTMVWGPFIFLAIDGWLRHRTPGWLLLGAASVALQILAGHPQYVFYTGVAAGLYSVGQLAVAPRRLQATAGLAVIALAGAALSAVQLFEGLHAAGESVRNHGTDRTFAALFSLPPENFVTLLTPFFFGNLTDHAYWGRWFLWEMSLFCGVTGLVMAGYALTKAPRFRVWSPAAVAFVLLVLALGSYTPLFPWLYRYAPGFGRFRGWSKFSYPAMLLLVVVAATGFDVLLRERARGARLGLIVLCAGLGVSVLACFAIQAGDVAPPSAAQPWSAWIQKLAGTNEQYLPASLARAPGYARVAGLYASRQLWFAAVTLLALGAMLVFARRRPGALAGVLVLACLEMLCFARSCLSDFPLRKVFDTPDARFLSTHPGGFRVDNENNHNLAMSLGGYDVWGYDPGVLRRYAEWISASQDRDPDDASETMQIDRLPPAFATLLRARYVIPQDWSPDDGEELITRNDARTTPAARLMLVTRARVIAGRDAELDAVFDPAFEPTREVLLETAPVPAPTGVEQPGAVRLVQEMTDALTIEADLRAPAILLVTDTYSDGWHARSLLPDRGDGAQTRYQVLPADYCLRGIPLDKGHHKILLEYRPTAYVVGKWVSLVSWGLFIAGLFAWNARRRKGSLPPATAGTPLEEKPLTASAERASLPLPPG